MDAETWFNAKKAVELGFADEIMFSEGSTDKADINVSDSAEPFVFSRQAVMNSMLSKLIPSKEEAKVTEKRTPKAQLEKRLNLISH